MVCNLWDWLLLLNTIPLKFIQAVTFINSSFRFIAEVYPGYAYAVVCITIHPLKHSSVVSSLGLLSMKLLWTCVCAFCVNIGFYFSGINANSANPGSCDHCMFTGMLLSSPILSSPVSSLLLNLRNEFFNSDTLYFDWHFFHWFFLKFLFFCWITPYFARFVYPFL